MCLAVAPAASRNISRRQVQDGAVAAGGEVQRARLALSSAMNSFAVGGGHLGGLTTSTIGVAPTTAMGVKSPGMSNGSDLSTLGKITTLFDTTRQRVAVGRASAPAPAGRRRRRRRAGSRPPPDASSALRAPGCAARVMASTPEPVALGRMNLTVPVRLREDGQRGQAGGGGGQARQREHASRREKGSDSLTHGRCLREYSDGRLRPPTAPGQQLVDLAARQ